MKKSIIAMLVLMQSFCLGASFVAENANVKIQANGDFTPTGNIAITIDGKVTTINMMTLIRLQTAIGYLYQPKITPVELKIYIPASNSQILK